MCLYKFANYTAWGKWRLGRKNHDPAPKLVAYALTRSFSHASHRSGHDSLSPIAACLLPHCQCCDYLEPAPWGLICAMIRSVGSQHVHEPASLRWMMVHCTYLFVCVSESSYTAACITLIDNVQTDRYSAPSSTSGSWAHTHAARPWVRALGRGSFSPIATFLKLCN